MYNYQILYYNQLIFLTQHPYKVKFIKHLLTNSSATRLATLVAATVRGCVMQI